MDPEPTPPPIVGVIVSYVLFITILSLLFIFGPQVIQWVALTFHEVIT